MHRGEDPEESFRAIDMRGSLLMLAYAMDALYGAAAPRMLRYWRELEELEAAETTGLTWHGVGFGVFSYLTADRLLRWSRQFDAMEADVANDPQRLDAVRDACVNLDEAILSVRFRLPDLPEFEPQLLAGRIRREIARAFDERTRPPVQNWERFRTYNLDQRLANGVEYFAARCSTPRPLPPGLPEGLEASQVLRVLPTAWLGSTISHLHHLQPDAEAAFGVARQCNRDKPQLSSAVLGFFESSGDKFYAQLNDRNSTPLAELASHPGKYRAYYLGSTRLWPQSYLSLSNLDTSATAPLGQFFDAASPDAEYDLYLSVKQDADNAVWLDQLLLVRRPGPPRPQQVTLAPPVG